MPSPRPPGTVVPDNPAQRQRLARATGWLYLVIAICGMFAPTLLDSLLLPGDAAATASAIRAAHFPFALSLLAWLVIVAADSAVAVMAALLLAPFGRTLALIAGAFRLVYTAVLGALVINLFEAYRLLLGTGAADSGASLRALAALEGFDTGFLAALIIFGAHLLILGGLFYRSRTIPRVLALLLIAAGIGYGTDSLATFFVAGHGGWPRVLLMAPAILGEVGLTLWLLVKGIAAPRTIGDMSSGGAGCTVPRAKIAGGFQ